MYAIDKKTSERIYILKGLLMVLVVLVHAYREEITFVDGNVQLRAAPWLEWGRYIVSQVVARAAVPAFFLISSVLLYRREFTWKQNMSKKVYTLLIPYVILNSCWILFFYFAQFFDFTLPYFVTPQSKIAEWGILGWLDAYFGNFIDEYPVLYPTWFLRDLLLLNAAATGIKKCVDAFPGITLAVIGCLWLLPFSIPFIGGTELSGQGVVFFVLGYYIVKYDLHMEQLDSVPCAAAAAVYGALVGITAYLNFPRGGHAAEGTLFVWFQGTGFGYMVSHITIAAGVLFFIRFSRVFAESKGKPLFMKFAGHSFFIFAFHEMALTIALKLLAKKFVQTTKVQLFGYIGIPLFVIAGCVLFSMFVGRFLPFAYYVISGKRVDRQRRCRLQSQDGQS